MEEWFSANGKNQTATSSSPRPNQNPTVTRNNFPRPENYFQPNGDFAVARNRLPSPADQIYPFQPETSPYRSDLHRNMARQNGNYLSALNPRCPAGTLYDSLINDFTGLNLSTTSSVHYQSPYLASSALNGGSGSILGNSSTSSVHYQSLINGFPEQLDLQRLRVQSAARGQYIQQPQSFLPSGDHESLDSFALPNSLNSNAFGTNEFDNLYGGRNLVNSPSIRPRNGFRFQSPYPFGFRVPDNSSYNSGRLEIPAIQARARGRPTNNGFSGSITPSLNMNSYSSLYTSRVNPKFLESLEVGWRVKVLWLATDQHGCRFLQKKFEEGKDEDIDLIFSEIKEHIRPLMVHQFGNYLIQKFFEVCDQAKISQILASVVSHEQTLLKICFDIHGTRAMQKLLEHLTTPEQRTSFASILGRDSVTVALTKSPHGHHVIQHCLKFFSSEEIEPILRVVADNCVPIAMDRSGCCVLQQCVLCAPREAKERLVTEITANALQLTQDPYGNYVVQYVMAIPCYTAAILNALAGNFVSLSMDKYGSNVVEKFIKDCSEDQSAKVITEITNSRDFLTVVQDAFGNYVAQTAHQYSQGDLHESITNFMQRNYAFLHSHPHGKRVLARARGSRHAMY